ncbi:ATP-dependent DNA ligase [Proteobacteria bacterium 005FR1]|nr:ATP-dependent DNA ligase [Proteobacteria bacterium 005FR1]
MTLLANLADTYQSLAETSSRTAKINRLAEQIASLDHEDIEVGAHFLAGEIRQGKIGVGYATLKDLLGTEAADEPDLSLAEVDEELQALTAIRGSGSSRERKARLGQLFSRATRSEQELLFGLLRGELRQGALEAMVVEAIARAASLPATAVRQAAMFAGDLGAVARAALEEGDLGLSRFQLQIFCPVAPMLAQTAADVSGALDVLGEAAFEWKLDGARVQVHRSGGEVRVYTRAGNEVTEAVPEVVEAVAGLPLEEVVLDGEAIALDRADRPLPFQLTMRRFGRKLDVENLRQDLPLAVFFFDCLRLEGRDLTAETTRDRIAALERCLPERLRIPRLVTKDSEQALTFYKQALARGHEGLMAKSLEASYEAGNRGAGWLKIKRTHTLDLVVLAAEWGSGRRQGWLSNLHLGARNEEGGFTMLGKTFKGLTDRLLEWQTRELLARETHRQGSAVFVKPELVVEIAFNDIQTSPRYSGGLALRFARVKRYRNDKSAAEADTMATVRSLFEAQSAHLHPDL